MSNGLLAAASRVMEFYEAMGIVADEEGARALDDLGAAIARERESNRTRVARMRARRKEQADA